MIVKPTVNELLEHAENRFALVIATSRRARQIANGAPKLTDVDEESPVTIAANEINEGKVVICDEIPDEDEQETEKEQEEKEEKEEKDEEQKEQEDEEKVEEDSQEEQENEEDSQEEDK